MNYNPQDTELQGNAQIETERMRELLSEYTMPQHKPGIAS